MTATTSETEALKQRILSGRQAQEDLHEVTREWQQLTLEEQAAEKSFRARRDALAARQHMLQQAVSVGKSSEQQWKSRQPAQHAEIGSLKDQRQAALERIERCRAEQATLPGEIAKRRSAAKSVLEATGEKNHAQILEHNRFAERLEARLTEAAQDVAKCEARLREIDATMAELERNRLPV